MLVGYYYKLKGLFTRFRALTGVLIGWISARVAGAELGDKTIEEKSKVRKGSIALRFWCEATPEARNQNVVA